MPEFLKPIKMVDWLILAVGVLLFATMDYSNLSTIDKVYIGSMALWVVLLGGRLYVENKKSGKK